jgi:hypothetical protein
MEALLRDRQGIGKNSIMGAPSVSSIFGTVRNNATDPSRRIVHARFSCSEHVLEILFDDGMVVDFDLSGLGPAPTSCD